jgi:hypothetical protein
VADERAWLSGPCPYGGRPALDPVGHLFIAVYRNRLVEWSWYRWMRFHDPLLFPMRGLFDVLSFVIVSSDKNPTSSPP